MNNTVQVCWFSFGIGFLMGHGEPINIFTLESRK